MSRNTEYEFIPTDTTELVNQMVADYEAMTGETVHPASPEMLMIRWVASIILAERVKGNYAANQNLPSRAEGENLDALAELFYTQERTPAKPAVCTVRFYISAAQGSAILVPEGTRVTDGSQKLYWATLEDAWVEIGDTYVDALVQCQTPGIVGNGWIPGSINTAVDVYDYYSACASTTTSDGGSEELSDDEFYEILRASLDGMSTAGARGNYLYHAKATSSQISDVVVNSPAAGEIRIYVLDVDGQTWTNPGDSGDVRKFPGKAGSTLKALVLAACNDDSVRPLTDKVLMSDPTEYAYNVNLTYYISSQATQTATIDQEVKDTVNAYITWQQGKLGRDINPSKLISMLMAIPGIKRVDVTAPAYHALQDGDLSLYETDPIILADTIPQIGKIGTITLTNGGPEDE